MRLIGYSTITYDNLGHAALCLLHRFPKWKAYALENHRPLVETLARMGSWSAREMLGIPKEAKYDAATDAELANRFFLGNEATLQALRAGYSNRP